MKIVSDKDALSQALQSLGPARAAVAYVGEAWERYLPDLREIVLAPTIGSNPKAIRAIISRIGIERVHFLESLHAKIYVGADKAVLGSCNLSDRGLGPTCPRGLHEAAVLVRSRSSVTRLTRLFEQYKTLAVRAFPTSDQKLARLERLEREWEAGIHCHAVTDDMLPKPISNSTIGPRVLLLWFDSYDLKLDKSAIRASIPEARDPYEFFADYFSFMEDDDVRPGDWVLSWERRVDGMPKANRRLHWMYVHDVIPNAVRQDKPFTKFAGQRATAGVPAVPFRLEAGTQKAILAALSSEKFRALRSNRDGKWSISAWTKRSKEFWRFLGAKFEP